MALRHTYYVIIIIVICSLCQQHVFGALIISIKNQFRWDLLEIAAHRFGHVLNSGTHFDLITLIEICEDTQCTKIYQII